MLGRITAASRFAATPMRSALAPKVGPGSIRSFAAAAPSAPKPLSIRMDSLFVKCMISAVVYFVPQDAVFLTGLFWYWHTQGTTAAPKKKQADAEAALEAFKAQKGLGDVQVSKGSRTWQVTM